MLFNSNSFNIPDICEYFVHELRSVTNLDSNFYLGIQIENKKFLMKKKTLYIVILFYHIFCFKNTNYLLKFKKFFLSFKIIIK